MKTHTDPTSAVAEKKRPRKRLFLLLLLTIALTFVVGYAVIQWVGSTSLDHAQQSIDDRHPLITVIHLAVIAAIAAFWEQMIRFFAQRSKMSDEAIQAWVGWRWRAVGWLVLWEIVFVQDGLSSLFAALN